MNANRILGFVSLALVLGAAARADDWSKLSNAAIARQDLVDARVGVQTDRGRRAILHVKGGDSLRIERIQYVYADGDKVLATPITLPGSYTLDVDTATVAAAGSDVWWSRDGRGSDRLVPIGGARICLLGPARDPFAPRAPAAFAGANLSGRSIPREDLRSARVLVVTDRGNYAIVDVRAGDDLIIDHVVVLDPYGRTLLDRYAFELPSSYSIDLDTGTLGGGSADLWWQWDVNDEFHLVPRNGARMALAR